MFECLIIRLVEECCICVVVGDLILVGIGCGDG